MAALKRLDALDQRVLTVLRVPVLTGWIRWHPVAALVILVVLVYCPLILRLVADPVWLGAVSFVAALLGVIWLVVAAIAAVEDMNDRGARGWIWGLLILLTNVIGLFTWTVARKDVPSMTDTGMS